MHEVSMFGGPLHHLGCRLGLSRDGKSLGLGVAIAVFAWGVLVLLTLLRGAGHTVFSLAAIGVHVRLLAAIPLFFLCETWVFPRMSEFMREIVSVGLIPESELPAFESVIRRINRLKDSWLAEVVLILVALGLPMVVEIPGRTGNFGALLAQAGGRPGPVIGWYLGVCLPLFRFLLLRWVWKLGLWGYFLVRVQRLKLNLIPTHPDRVGGLGYLEVVQENFAPLIMAMTATYAASSAEDIAAGVMAFEHLYRTVPVLLLLIVTLFIGPLFIFAPLLWQCRMTGWRAYMGMASRYVDAFDHRWIRDEKATGDALLGTPDLQSLADLNNSISVVRGMQIIPASQRLVIQLAMAAVLPLLPLLFFKYPVSEVAAKLFQTLTGL
jgi:hypothetical protein